MLNINIICMIESIAIQLALQKNIKLASANNNDYYIQVYNLWKNYLNEWMTYISSLNWGMLDQQTKLIYHNFGIFINRLFIFKIYSAPDLDTMNKYRKLNNSTHIDYKQNISKLCIETIDEWYNAKCLI